MRISVFGIGYGGAVTAACLCKDGHDVVAVDVNDVKINELNDGLAPIAEPGLAPLIAAAVASGRLRATDRAEEAVRTTELSFVCVGTPSRLNGSLDTRCVLKVIEEIGAALAGKTERHHVVVRSTILPGTMVESVIPALERAAGGVAGRDFGVAYYPGFLRESTAIADDDAPGAIVLGKLDEDTIVKLRALVCRTGVEPIVVDMTTAEAVKYANNAWHAVKVSFANEMGNVCKGSGIDGHEVMRILCRDERLNISPAYLMPGFAFGGSSLPKDLRALRYKARTIDVDTPVLDAVMSANEIQLERALGMVTATGARRLGLFGLSFKPGTDDLRESPLVELAERLLGKGYVLKIYDPDVSYGELTGANLQYVMSHLPHLRRLLVDTADDMCHGAQAIIIGKNGTVAAGLVERLGGRTPIIDLVRVDAVQRSDGSYDGICW
jgi:GDP-mannose 6-dehydrogenase